MISEAARHSAGVRQPIDLRAGYRRRNCSTGMPGTSIRLLLTVFIIRILAEFLEGQAAKARGSFFP